MNHSRRWIVSAYFICSTLIGALWLDHYGLSTSSDSLKYLNASTSWDQLLALNGVWPPGYSGLIWVLSSFGLSTVTAASVLSSFAISLALYALFDLGKNLNSWTYGVLSASILLLYTDIHTIALTVLSEGIFCGLLIVFCVQLWHWLSKPTNQTLYNMTALVGLICLIRYAGYVLIPALFYAVWIRREHIPWKNWSIATGLSFSPLFSWLLYNLNRYEHLHGSRKPSTVGWTENLTRLWETASVNLLAGGLLLLFALCSLLLIRKLKNGTDADKNSWTWVYILWGIIGLQTFLTLYSSSTVLLDPINTRLTAGIYTLVVPLSIVGALQVVQWIPKVNPLFIMVGLLLSIVVAQSISDPDRESKTRQRDFDAKYTEHSFINLFGFNQSNTASELRSYFEDRLSASIVPVHVLWFEQSRSNQKFQLLHHRNFLFEDRLERVSVTSSDEQIRFALTVDGENRSLIVHNLIRIKNKERLQEQIQSTMSQTKQSQTILVGRKPMLKNWQALTMDWSVEDKLYQCTFEQNALQYAIIECKDDSEKVVEPPTTQTETPSLKSLAPSTPEPKIFTKRTLPFLSEVMQLPLKVVKFRGEWIELYNPTEETVDLSTYSIHSKDDTGVSFTKEHTIPPKSTFLMAVRKSPTGNGGLPKVDFLYNHGVLKVAGTDWIELRNGTEVVDRWELSRKEVREGYSLQRNEDGTVCYSTEPYGDGDFGSPKTLHRCP